ncbi:MAG TPA: AMMECR1 domain-containing protein [Sulfurovum sp. UBA12169]|nr:MAG TPA: AMMECR1 domain-containing protein [Sulfurovum sp. UBA12169]
MDKRILLDIALEAIEEEFAGRQQQIDKNKWIAQYPWLQEYGAVFVTLNENHRLRGCIGSIIAHRPLIEDVIYNAKAAAFSDPRFLPLGVEEFDKIELEISLLTSPKEVSYADKKSLRQIIRPKTDGVILKQGNYQATYLPSVWEQLPHFDDFFGSLCQKAGLSGNCLDAHPVIYRYQAEKITRDL